MASLIKIKRSNVAAKRPTTSDIAAGELALNTKDKRAFSSDGGVVFEIGANVHSLSVGSGAFSIANGAITFPTSDGSVGQVLSTDGSGTLSFSSILSTSTFNSALANTNSYIAAVETREAAHTANTLLHLANTNSYIATKVSTSTFNSALANTNSYIAAVETREAAHTANTLLHLANTNSYIATKVSTSTFNSALANTNSYIATVQSDVDSNEATERAALANTNSYIATKANIASPTFTGVPAAPTASAGTNTTQIATTAFVRTEVTNLIDSAPTTLDTLNELAAALGDDPNFATTIASTYQTKSVERAALANTNSYIATKLSSSSYTAADVLSKLLTVDGAGTGLDADTLDGVQGSSFLRSDAADTASGNITFSGTVTFDSGTNTTVDIVSDDGGKSHLRLYGAAQGTGAVEVGQSTAYGGGMSYNGDGSPAFVSGETTDHITFYRLDNGTRTEVFHYPYNSNIVNFNSTPTVSGSSVWHAGNDGSGSGLDADTLDGQQGSYYLNTSTTFGGDVSGTYNAIVVANDSHTHAFNNLTGKTSGTGEYSTDSHITSGRGSGGVSLTINDGYGNANITWNHKSGVPEQNGNAARIEVNTDSTSGMAFWFEGKSNVTGGVGVSLTNLFTMSETGATCLGNTVWHAGNDGSGSGLDADTLDGVQGSSFLRSDANDSFSGAITGTGSISITGAFSATTKSFVIDHPTKEGMKLRYGSLEGPENGVYVRGRLKDNNVIELPDYWTGLVDEDTITVNLTAIGKSQNLYVADIKDNKVYVKGSRQINCFYTVFGERKDVDKLEVEYESE